LHLPLLRSPLLHRPLLHLHQTFPARLVSTLLIGMAGLILPTMAAATPLLRCEVEQGGTVKVLEFTPVSDPYLVKAIDINGRFRFKAVVIGSARHVDYIKIYTYSQLSRQPMLMHEAEYMAPAISTASSKPSLTGVHHVYSVDLERELKYACTLLEAAP